MPKMDRRSAMMMAGLGLAVVAAPTPNAAANPSRPMAAAAAGRRRRPPDAPPAAAGAPPPPFGAPPSSGRGAGRTSVTSSMDRPVRRRIRRCGPSPSAAR